MKTRIILFITLFLLIAPHAAAKVTGENTDQLPPHCDEIRGHEEITVHGGKHFAEDHPGTIFTYDEHTYNFPPCTKVTVTFVNNDSVRHQWMVHGLPASIHEMSMFNIEVTGPGKDTGTFITPAEPETLMVHCGVPQHEQKGMKAQVKVGGGTGTLAGIPGVSGKVNEFRYPRKSHVPLSALMLIAGLLFGVVVAYTGPHRRLQRWLAEQHDIHVTLGRFGIDVHTGPTTEQPEEAEETKTETESEEPAEDDESPEVDEDGTEKDTDGKEEAEEPETEPEEPKEPVAPVQETDAGGDGDDDWLEDEDDSEVGNW